MSTSQLQDKLFDHLKRLRNFFSLYFFFQWTHVLLRKNAIFTKRWILLKCSWGVFDRLTAFDVLPKVVTVHLKFLQYLETNLLLFKKQRKKALEVLNHGKKSCSHFHSRYRFLRYTLVDFCEFSFLSLWKFNCDTKLLFLLKIRLNLKISHWMGACPRRYKNALRVVEASLKYLTFDHCYKLT